MVPGLLSLFCDCHFIKYQHSSIHGVPEMAFQGSFAVFNSESRRIDWTLLFFTVIVN